MNIFFSKDNEILSHILAVKHEIFVHYTGNFEKTEQISFIVDIRERG
jgi:hypothetical protein